jgi:hypothetical protein
MMLLKALQLSRHTYIGKAVAKLGVMRKFERCEVDPKSLTCKCPNFGFIKSSSESSTQLSGARLI